MPEIRGGEVRSAAINEADAVLGAAHALEAGVFGSGDVGVAADDENLGVLGDVVPERARPAFSLVGMGGRAGLAILDVVGGRDAAFRADVLAPVL